MSRQPGLPASAIAKLVEKQMRNWELARSQRAETPSPQGRTVQDFVTVSRLLGSGGAEVATVLGERLSWPVFDKGILHAMAGDDVIRQRLYSSMDERDLGWLEEMLRSLMQSEFPKNDYVHRLTETVLSLARQGRAVFLGRGADLILPRDIGLRVRIVAPADDCVKRLAERQNLPIEQARALFESTEHERTRFVEHHFRVAADDPCRFDLVINLQRMTPADAVELIMSAMATRGALP